MDYQGKIEPPSVRGFTGFYLFKDSCTGHRHAVMVKSKDAATYLSILGQVAIVEGAPDTLLSIAVLTARGFEVRFLTSGQGVGIYKDQKLLFHGPGPQHEQSRLFHIDIQSLIHPPSI